MASITVQIHSGKSMLSKQQDLGCLLFVTPLGWEGGMAKQLFKYQHDMGAKKKG